MLVPSEQSPASGSLLRPCQTSRGVHVIVVGWNLLTQIWNETISQKFLFSLQWHRVSLIRDESDGPPKDAAHLLECAYLQPWDWTYVSINLFVEFCLLVSFKTYGAVSC